MTATTGGVAAQAQAACACGATSPCLACRLAPSDYLAVKDAWLHSRSALSGESGTPPFEWAIGVAPGSLVASWDWPSQCFRPLTAEPPAGPRYAWLEITTHCPHRCRHCFLGERLGQGHAPLAAVSAALAALPAWDVDEVVLSGGEPTMHPAFLTILESARRAASRVRVLTNGWTQLPAVVAALAQPGVRVEIPLLGWEDDHDHMTRTRGSFARICRSLALYREAGVDLTLTTTLTRYGLKALPQLTALAQGLGIPFVPSPLLPQGLAAQAWADLAPEGQAIA